MVFQQGNISKCSCIFVELLGGSDQIWHFHVYQRLNAEICHYSWIYFYIHWSISLLIDLFCLTLSTINNGSYKCWFFFIDALSKFSQLFHCLSGKHCLYWSLREFSALSHPQCLTIFYYKEDYQKLCLPGCFIQIKRFKYLGFN